MIEKKIHYCWLSQDSFPKEIQEYIDGWKLKLPEYEFILWDTNKFPLEKSLWVKQAYEEKKYAFAADYIRLYALYNEGGIYLDTDVEVLKRFDDLLDLPYFAGTEGENWIEAGIFGSEPGVDWLKDCLDYFDKPFIKEDGSYDIIPLPQVMNAVISKKRNIVNVNKDIIFKQSRKDFHKKFYLFDKDYFTAKDMGTGKLFNTKNTYTIHHFAMSWIDPKFKNLSKIKKRLMKMFGVNSVNKFINIFRLKQLKNLFLK